jgi:hypothetical protein
LLSSEQSDPAKVEMMRRRKLLGLVTGTIVTWPFAVFAHRSYRLGCLLPLPSDAPENIAFFEELRRRGFIVGQNLAIEYRAYGGRPGLISQYAEELVNARVDAIVRFNRQRPVSGGGALVVAPSPEP